MKKFAAIALLSSCLASTALAALSPNAFDPERTPHNPANQQQQQQPLAMPESNSSPSSTLALSDVLARDTSISIFAGLIRDVEPVASRLRDTASNTTVLAPLNAALMQMPRKPWEDPQDYSAFGASAYEGADGESRAHANLRRFVEAHLVPASPWVPGKSVETLAGTSVELVQEGGKTCVKPDGVAVVGVADRVSNGQVWIVDGVLSRP